MKNLFYRIRNASVLFIWGLKNPKVFSEANFKFLSSLYNMILKVAAERRPMMTNIALVHPHESDLGDLEVVSVWAGAGVGAEPTKRIAELLEENRILKEEISQLIKSNNTHA